MLLGPILVNFPKSASYPNAKEGLVSLSAFQFRGHGLYSDLDVPWDVEILEYTWTVELILGDFTTRINPIHVRIVEMCLEKSNLSLSFIFSRL